MRYFVRYLLMVYVYAFLWNSTTANPVKVLNDLLTYPGWTELKYWGTYLTVERQVDDEKLVCVGDLLASSGNGPIATKENVDDKIRQTHQFFMCNLVDQMRRYCDYVRAMIPLCERMLCTNESFRCYCTNLERYVELFKGGETIVMYMREALSSLSQLSSQTEYHTIVSEILEEISNIYDVKTLDDSALKKKIAISLSAVPDDVKDIDGDILKIQQKLTALFVMYCWQDRDWDRECSGISYASLKVKNLTRLNTPGRAVISTMKSAKQERESVLKFFDGSFGFKHNPETKSVQIIEDIWYFIEICTIYSESVFVKKPHDDNIFNY